MRKSFIFFAAILTILSSGRQAEAATVLAYSFETLLPGPDGFFGLGATISQEPTIGVTHLSHSLKYEIGVGGFVGGRTEFIPPALNDPPGVVRVLFDLTITSIYTGVFADLGVTVFGHDLNPDGGMSFGNQVQFADIIDMQALGIGTFTDQEIVLDLSVGPYRAGESFNDIFGPGSDDLAVASAFQFFVSKDVLIPFTFYLDNVRLDDGSPVAAVPEPASLSMFGLGAATLALFRRRRK